MIKKFLLSAVLIFAIFTMTACSSFEKLGIEDAINGYFDWFENNVINDNKTNDSDDKINGDNESVNVTITLDQEKIIF